MLLAPLPAVVLLSIPGLVTAMILPMSAVPVPELGLVLFVARKPGFASAS
jgi:hypothetical protein